MKLILANNQSERFVAFYEKLQGESDTPFAYQAYSSFVFVFDPDAAQSITVTNVEDGRSLTAYDGVYINGYLSTYELAATMAICCRALGVPFVNQEFSSPPSLSKLSMYAKLAAAGVRVPKTIAGTKYALLKSDLSGWKFPMVLKRADADRGIDNYKVAAISDIEPLLAPHAPRSLWLLQEYIENDGFYLVSFYNQELAFSIFRSLEERPDGNAQKAHMYKPKGGANARLVPHDELPQQLLETSEQAMRALNRQIGSVDCLFDARRNRTYVLEVNYNPQLVTIETFREVRIDAFLKGIAQI